MTISIQQDRNRWCVWEDGQFVCSTESEAQAITVRNALSALEIYVSSDLAIVELCRRAGVDTDYCGNNAQSCVAALAEKVK